MGSATLPAVLVSRADGSNLLKLAQGGTTVDLDFDGKTAMPYPANVVTDFSSVGPTPGANLKPDIVAVGDWLVAPTATTAESTGCTAPYSLDLNVGCYPPYTFLDSPFLLDFLFQIGFGALWDDGAGTSFSTPIVTGTIAMVMAAKPGLTAAQYRSLVTNSSPEFDQFAGNAVAPPQLAGGGILDGLGALQQGLTASPSTLNFLTSASGGGSSSSAALKAQDQTGASSSRSQTLTLTNIGASDTFTVSFKSLDGVATPSPDSANFNLANGASKTITLTLPGSLAAGQYHGFVLVSGTKGQTQLRVPYWYGVAGNTAQNINVLFNPGFDPSACNDTIDFRLLDAVGLPVTPAADPTVTTNATRASVTKVSLLGSIPGTYEAQIVTGRPDSNGNNVFTVSADNSTWQIVIGIDNSGATPCNGSSSGSGGASIRSRALKHSRTPARSADSKQ